MAIDINRYKNYNEKQNTANALAEQMATEGEEESDWGQFMSIAAPLAASLILPGVGTALMGGLTSMAGAGAAGGTLATLLGGAGTAATAGTAAVAGGAAATAGTAGIAGTGLLGALAGTGTGLASTIGGGLMTGAAKAGGQYAISQGIDEFGREVLDKGGDTEDIGVGGGFRARQASKEARASLSSSISAKDDSMKSSALISGLTQGFDTMGGFDKVKEMSAEAGSNMFGGAKRKAEAATLASATALAEETALKEGQQFGSALGQEALDSGGKRDITSIIQELSGKEATELVVPSPITDAIKDTSINTISGSLLSSGSSEEYPPELQAYFANNPNITEEEKAELLAQFGMGVQ